MNCDGRIELGELTTLFNALLESQQGQKSAREDRLHNVNLSLNEMIEQIDRIQRISLTTRHNVDGSRTSMEELDHLAEQVRRTSSEVEAYSRQTEDFLGDIDVILQQLRHSASDVNGRMSGIAETTMKQARLAKTCSTPPTACATSHAYRCRWLNRPPTMCRKRCTTSATSRRPWAAWARK